MPSWNMSAKIRGALRQIFRMSPEHKAVLHAARVEKPKYNKDGSMSKRPEVFFVCNKCKGLFKRKEVEVDHIDGLPPSPHTRDATDKDTWDRLINEMWYSPMQCLCKSCHREKSYGR